MTDEPLDMRRKRNYRINPRVEAEHREAINASKIINRLNKLINGEISPASMPPHVVTAALGLLKKRIPDLTNVAHSGEVTVEVAVDVGPKLESLINRAIATADEERVPKVIEGVKST